MLLALFLAIAALAALVWSIDAEDDREAAAALIASTSLVMAVLVAL